MFSRETTTNTLPAAMAAVIEPAAVLDRAAVSGRTTQPVKLTTASLAHTSPDLNQPGLERENSSPSVVEISTPPPLEARGGRKYIEASSSSAAVGHISNPYWEGASRGHVHPSANTTDTDTRLRRSPRKSAYNSPSDNSQLHRTASSIPSRTAPPSGQTRTQSTNPQTPHGPSQQRTTLSQPLSSPSQRAMDTLHNILHLKRQLGRDPSESPNPSAVSPSPSPLRKLYPLPKTPQSGSPSRRSPGSSADAVAAAINQGSRLDRQGPSGTPLPSTPLRVYKKRTSPLAIPVQRSEGSEAPQIYVEGSPQSSGGHSTPPIAVLRPMESSSEKASSSIYGEEYDELEFSYPSSPMRPSPTPGVPPDPLPPSDVPADLPRPAAELAEQATQPSPASFTPPPSENTTMRTSALRYLEQYFQTFDIDRRALAEAYAPDAAFSCSSRKLRAQGRDGIVEALEALGPGILCSGHRVEYDVTYIDPHIGVLLVALGTMGDTRGDNTGEVGYAMSFVLRPGREDQERCV